MTEEPQFPPFPDEYNYSHSDHREWLEDFKKWLRFRMKNNRSGKVGHTERHCKVCVENALLEEILEGLG